MLMHTQVGQFGIVLANAECQILSAEIGPFSSWIGRSRPHDKVIGLPLTARRAGFVDWRFSAHGLIVDLKTTERLPSAIGASHGRQGAVYATHGNFGMRFATAAKFMQAA